MTTGNSTYFARALKTFRILEVRVWVLHLITSFQGGTVMCCYIGKAAEAPGQLNDVTDRLILAHFTETSVWKLMLLCALAKPIS